MRLKSTEIRKHLYSTMQSTKELWDRAYESRSAESLSWYQEHARLSLRWIREAGVACDAPIIDIGSGASTLVDDLLAAGYPNITILDISSSALATAKKRLGPASEPVRWIQADITQALLDEHAYEVWHDRAVFHFLDSRLERQRYVDRVYRAVRPEGHVIVAVFALDGPERCSGLPAARYSPETLYAEFGESFELVRHERELHQTPSGIIQPFIYCHFRKIRLHPIPEKHQSRQ